MAQTKAAPSWGAHLKNLSVKVSTSLLVIRVNRLHTNYHVFIRKAFFPRLCGVTNSVEYLHNLSTMHNSFDSSEKPTVLA